MATLSHRSAAGISAASTLLLVLAFGNPAYRYWVDHTQSGSTAGGLFLRTLAWPSWRFTTGGSAATVRDVLSDDLRAILLVVLTGVIVGVASLAGRRAGVFFTCWACVCLAAGIAGFVAAFLAHDASLVGSMLTAAAGAEYGLFVGWVVGLFGLLSRG